jgi:hypothetical protein
LSTKPEVALRSTPGYRRSSRWDDSEATRIGWLHRTEWQMPPALVVLTKTHRSDFDLNTINSEEPEFIDS